MSDSFTLRLPADARYRVIAAEIASRYVELLGGSDAERDALAASLAETLAGFGAEAPEASCELMFRPAATGIEVTVQCESRSSVVRQDLTARAGHAR